MHKKLMTFVFVCTVGFAPMASADLVGWWTFDEGTGTVAHDSSGNAIDGTFQGNPQWAAGMSGGALEFGGSDWVDFGSPAKLNINGPITIACWINPGSVSGVRSFVGYARAYAFKASSTNLQFTTPGILDHWGTKSPLKIGTWVHVAATFKPGTTNGLIFYVNGVESERLNSSTMSAGTGPLLIGNNEWSETFIGLIDDVRVYNAILPAAEIKKLAFRPKAYAPSPADGATGVMQPLMQWTSGSSAQWHMIYLGTTPDLGQADFKAKQMQMQTMYYHFAGLQPGVTYYWRIDEMEADNKTVYQGDVWSFTTAPVTAYAPNPRNGDKWIDPNADLSWLAGQNAFTHELYFGTDQAKVAARDAGVFKGSLNVTTFEPGKLAMQTTYYWVVDEVGTAKQAGEVWSFTTTDGGGGAKGEYFNNMTVAGAPALTRIDPAIDFSWGDPGGPGAPIGTDNFSARWTADLEIAIADTYTFITTSDDGVRLWLGDAMIVDSWVDQGGIDHASKPQKLEPGIYPLRMEYYENLGGAVAQLSWQTPFVARQIIPAGPLQPPVRARAIYPKNNDVNVPQDVTLTWSIGDKAVTHDVYFGTDPAAVAAATPADAGIYQGSQSLDENTFVPGALEWNKTYCWRVDEVNDAAADSPWKGTVWSFTTADFIVVDDFESYVDDVEGRIFQTWIDGWGYTEPAPGNPGNGTGSTVGYTNPPFAEQSIVRGGRQSMPFDYNNIVPPYYSEAERTWDSPQNWKVNGVTDLSLQVHGYPVSFIETSPGNITMSASGADIVNVTDEFRYAYKRLSGDGSLTVRVESLVNTATWAKAGAIIRAGLEPAAQQVHMIVTPANLVEFMYRRDSGLNTTQFATDAGSTPLPYWVRLTRKGSTFTGEYSANGITWTKITATDGTTSVIDVPMLGDVYIGLAVTATNRSAVTTAVFSNVQVTGATGPWQVAEIGYDHPGNDPASLYVALQDGAGKLAVVTNPDTNIVLGTQWTQWKIPLSQFTGVNLGAVKKMYIGVGDRKNPQADGTGKLFIDDIRVVKP
jgi:hypothetical protein